ncbi:uncharacterized protein A4U43_C05F33600 [Asparagus officinalis]|uniref:Two-component response regulator n=1 Tax=Asparagus officinalis TaxID=4686 RepID=A0A5P1EWG4_ASPOF|nr:two-component response regulator ORR22-like [Asparagus officinalis]ONK70425.1 uncharacterized protein A4U43_C05F33600 [Asparagus officinalis]
MTVVERSGSRDRFPIGMRVLAVDDDPTCLKVLESLLLRCQYHVTTTNQAIKALEMLRENKDQFDLVISDVHMPDMDGFKLLELVGLEMDLPVIMLSANGETQAVMKGITHGACDYLLKPVRIEELKNIWQHVIRRKKVDPRDNNNLDSGDDCDKNQLMNSEGGQGSLANGSSDQNRKLNRKRKDQNEEDDDDSEDNLNENEDSSTQKKPRVVWSVDLHRKFVAAVNQLGIDKAVPKRILDLMNVEKLTRENVASHLQKYRLYLKRLSAVANQQANMVAALRGRDTSYLPLGSLNGYPNFNSLVESRPLPNRSSFQPNGAVPRMNSFNGFGLHGFSLNNTNNPINDVSKLQCIGPIVQQPKAMQESSNSLLGGFSGSGVAIGHSNSFTNSAAKIPHIPSPLSSDPFEIGIGDSSHSADLSRCNESWQGAIPSTSYSGNTFATSLPFSHNDLSSGNIRENLSPIVSNLGSNARDSMMQNDRLANVHNQAGTLVTATGVNGDANLLNFRSVGNSSLKWEDPRRGHIQNPNQIYSSLSNTSSSGIRITDQNKGNQNLGNGFSNDKIDVPIISQANFRAPMLPLDSKSDKTAVGGQLHYKDEPLFEGMKLPGGFNSGGFGLDDLVTNAMIKPECDDFTFIDGDIGCNDLYSLGACM